MKYTFIYIPTQSVIITGRDCWMVLEGKPGSIAVFDTAKEAETQAEKLLSGGSIKSYIILSPISEILNQN